MPQHPHQSNASQPDQVEMEQGEAASVEALDAYSPPLRIQLLGGFRVAVGSRVIPAAAWPRRKAAHVVKLLALAPNHQLNRDQILDTLWPDLPLTSAVNNFHRTLHDARRILDRAAGNSSVQHSMLQLRHQVLALRRPGGLWVDADAFETAARARTSNAVAFYRTAIALYTGDLLPDDRYESWAAEPRERLRRVFLDLLFQLALIHGGRGELSDALDALQRITAAEPTHEEAHIALMRLYAGSGQRARALRQYHQLAESLRRELDVEPSEASRSLYEDILLDRHDKRAAGPQSHDGEPREHREWQQSNLPVPMTRFVGRQQEIGEILQLLVSTRLVTISGPGGSGKTRLAIEVARRSLGEFTDGVWMVDLSALRDQALVDQTVARTVRISESPGSSIVDALVTGLRDLHVLLVLDNCEHLVDACAELAAVLLCACPDLHILTTSREALNVPGEAVWSINPLAVPDSDQSIALEHLINVEAVQLFLDRARASWPHFAMSDENASLVTEIVRRLEGMPLAIELAAARLRMYSLADIRDRLGDSLSLLATNRRTVPARQQTLQATIDWSYHLLREEEQALLRRLSVFVGGFMLDAAREIGIEIGNQADEIESLVSELVNKSLVAAEEMAGTMRYRLLEVIRQYSAQRLREAGELEEVSRQHRDWYLALAERAEEELFGAGQSAWLDRLELEHDNFRAALNWSEQVSDWKAALRLAAALFRFWEMRGYITEGRAQLERSIAHGTDIPVNLRAKALNAAGCLARDQGDLEQAAALHQACLRRRRDIGDAHGIGSSLNNLGVVELEQLSLHGAKARFEESLEMFRQIGVPWEIANTLSNLGIVSRLLGDDQAASQRLDEALALWRRLGDRSSQARTLDAMGEIARDKANYETAADLHEQALTLRRDLQEQRSIAVSINNLALAELYRGHHQRARALAEEALALRQELADKRGIAISLATLARVCRIEGQVDQAETYYCAALRLRMEMGGREGIVDCLIGLAEIAAVREQFEHAARLLAASEHLRQDIGLKLPAADVELYEQALSITRAALPVEAYDLVSAQGLALSLEDATGLALRSPAAVR